MRRLLRITTHSIIIAILMLVGQATMPWPAYQWIFNSTSLGYFTVFGVTFASTMNRFPLGSMIAYASITLAYWPNLDALWTVAIPVLSGSIAGSMAAGIIRAFTKESTNDERTALVRDAARRDPEACGPQERDNNITVLEPRDRHARTEHRR